MNPTLKIPAPTGPVVPADEPFQHDSDAAHGHPSTCGECDSSADIVTVRANPSIRPRAGKLPNYKPDGTTTRLDTVAGRAEGEGSAGLLLAYCRNPACFQLHYSAPGVEPVEDDGLKAELETLWEKENEAIGRGGDA